MISSEISDLESFIDSYVTPDKNVNSSNQWSQTQSSEDSSGFPTNVKPSNEKFFSKQNDGTEIWGQKPGGNDWHASANAKVHDDWNDHRPKIQERLVQWQQPQHPPSLTQHQNYPPQAESPYFQQPQEPDNIQAIVTGLIRQNNMNKQNIPPWVDISQPPPTFQGGMNPPPLHQSPQMFNQHVQEPNLFYDPQDPRFSGQEPILQSMTFQRADAQVPNPQFHQMPPGPQMGEPWDNYNSGMFYQNSQVNNTAQPQFFNPPLPPANNPPHLPPANNPPHLPPANNPPPLVQSYPPNFNEPQNFDFHSEIMRGGHYETPNNLPPPLVQAGPPATGPPQEMPALAETPPHYIPTPSAQPLDTGIQTTPEQSAPVQSKYPNSRLRSSRGSGGESPTKAMEGSNKEGYQRQESEDVFENEHDNTRKAQSKSTSQSDRKKKPVQRKGSAADEDTNWRRKDGSDAKQSKGGLKTNRSFDGEARKKRNEAANHEKRERRDATPVANETRKNERNTSRTNKGSEGAQHRHLPNKQMGNVLSWLQNEPSGSGDTIGKEIRRLQISDSEADLSRFIEKVQSFATNESKMREVAEILCNKALKEPRFCHNASMLCDRMSFMMVQGTKFRSVVLNVMQGHYKNRDQLYASSYRRDRRWFGFVTFLVEIFLNVRTASRDRLLVLTNPVFNCLFQVLVGNQIDQEHIECFGRLFELVGSGLEAEDLDRLNQLMAEIRDRCVISKSDYVKRVLLRCVELYASKWKT